MNRLASETSPYLLQHAHNPVDWYPWGAEALERARHEDKPILLSIGYAACHWCHVMERESFENAAIATLMNTHFVNIKVDREERPDLDSIYMQAVQAMTGHGGWPMTVFLLPTGEPFYGGTYFPPTDRHGMPGFPRLLQALAAAYREDRVRVEETGRRIREIYGAAGGAAERAPSGVMPVTAAHLDRAASALADHFDATFAGFGGAPKFPPSMTLDFLLRHWARTEQAASLEMVQRTFLAMARGGITDQVGGGLHRYAVDERWLVPHFEKMLYDNALFIRVGVELWRATHDDEVRQATERAITWLGREMVNAEGGFHSSLDADSEGHEGRFYVWRSEDLDEALGADATVVKTAWGVTPAGNFEGRSIPFLPASPDALAARMAMSRQDLDSTLDRAREVLYPLRAQRPWPATDDKALASWNGLAVRALCAAAEAWGDHAAGELARRCGDFLRAHLVEDGRVHRSWRAGHVLRVGFLEDAAAVGLAFLDLFSLTGEATWLEDARTITARMIEEFRDAESGLFFDTPAHHEQLLARPRDVADNAMPSGGSLAAELLARLAVFEDRPDLETLARGIADPLANSIGRFPNAFGHLAGVADLLVHGAVEVAVPADQVELNRVLGSTYVPSRVCARDAGVSAIARGRSDGRAYVCRRYACSSPTSDPDRFRVELTEASKAHRTR